MIQNYYQLRTKRTRCSSAKTLYTKNYREQKIKQRRSSPAHTRLARLWEEQTWNYWTRRTVHRVVAGIHDLQAAKERTWLSVFNTPLIRPVILCLATFSLSHFQKECMDGASHWYDLDTFQAAFQNKKTTKSFRCSGLGSTYHADRLNETQWFRDRVSSLQEACSVCLGRTVQTRDECCVSDFNVLRAELKKGYLFLKECFSESGVRGV